MKSPIKTLVVVATGALLATSAFARSAASLVVPLGNLPRGEHKVPIDVVDPEDGVLTAQTVTFKSPGK